MGRALAGEVMTGRWRRDREMRAFCLSKNGLCCVGPGGEFFADEDLLLGHNVARSAVGCAPGLKSGALLSLLLDSCDWGYRLLGLAGLFCRPFRTSDCFCLLPTGAASFGRSTRGNLTAAHSALL